MWDIVRLFERGKWEHAEGGSRCVGTLKMSRLGSDSAMPAVVEQNNYPRLCSKREVVAACGECESD